MRGTNKQTTRSEESIHNDEMMMYDLNVTPRTSLDSQYTTATKDIKFSEKTNSTAAYPPEVDLSTLKHTPEDSESSFGQKQNSDAEKPHISPSLRLLFSLFPRRHLFLLLIPAILSSLVTGGIAPFMTIVVGQIFGFFSEFSTSISTSSSAPSAETRSELLRNVGVGCLELVGLAVGSLALGSLTSALWIWVGEVNTREVRRVVYEAVGKKDMGWFDLRMSGDSAEGVTEQEEGNGAVGAGGLMAKFSRETEDIRAASSLSLGQTLTHLTTSLTCLILAFLRSYQLTLVILSAVPLLMIVQGFSQGLASPLLAEEREETARAATSVERSLANISTVKAFNAQPLSLSHSAHSFKLLRHVAFRLNRVWGFTSGLSQFITMGMFVQGFWFGSKLVREGKVGVGDVMSVFWACLIASGNLQMCIPLWIVVVRGMESMVGVLLDVVVVGGDSYSTSHHAQTHNLRKITPSKCTGELAMHSVSFSYPSRPSLQVLKDVSLFLPANEVTFIVGGSGSGKSTVGGVLGGIYKPKDSGSGIVLLDEQDTRYLDEKWIRKHVVCVGQQGAAGVVILEGRSVFENILLGLGEEDEFSLVRAPVSTSSSSSSSSYPWTMDTAPPALRTRVETAARAALLHEFVRDLPMGYDTILGDSTNGEEGAAGMGLSGGQKQRLALARGILRDPTVLILDEPTSALDPTTRLLVFSAIKHIRHGPPSLHLPTSSFLPSPTPISRRNRTTVVITHDLSQIEKNDFVYVMKDGRVVEGGYRGDLEQVYVSTKETSERDDTASSATNGDDNGRGEFRKMLESQMRTGGCLPAVGDDQDDGSVSEDNVEIEGEEEEDYEEPTSQPDSLPRELASIRPLTWGDWMFEVVADLTRTASVTSPSSLDSSSPSSPSVPSPPLRNGKGNPFLSSSEKIRGQQVPSYKKRPSSIAVPRSPPILEEYDDFVFDNQNSLSMVPPAHFEEGRPTRKNTMKSVQTRRSLQFTPSSVATSFTVVDPYSQSGSRKTGYEAGWSNLPKEYMEERGYDVDDERESEEEEREFNVQKKAVQSSGNAVSARRTGRMLRMTVRSRQRRRREAGEVLDIKVHNPDDDSTQQDELRPAFWKLMRIILPTVPNKPLLFFGIGICILSGAMTPIFSFILSRLLFEVSIGATNTEAINFFGGLVLGIAALDGLLLGLKYFVMESVGMAWVTRIRTMAFSRVLKQDRAWFDEGVHAPERLAQVIVRDGDDARDLVSVVWGQFCVVLAMLGVGLLWALIQGWQLTLAGFAIAPVFAGVMALQSMLVANCEVRNKRAREEVARGYYEAIIHARSIRAMGFEGVFKKKFEDSVERALTTGVKGAMVEGCTYGVASGLIYLAEALLFYVGAILVAKGTYTYLQMVQVLNLVVFTVTIGSQLMAFTQRIAKCVQAASDFNILLNLSTTNTLESRGSLKHSPPSLFTSPIHFENISFSYPSRPSQPVLKNVDLTLYPGECVALVGASGSGKSTIAALLQRLYEPSGGKILLREGAGLDEVDVRWLRQHIGVVSQHPNLFDASVKDNIRYGALAAAAPFPQEEDALVIPDSLVISASQAALLHEFVESLPQGYDTHLGENASLISGGQAQRLMIARALARIWAATGDREGRLLVLDECTSALDGESQEKVLNTIRGLRSGSSSSHTMPTTTTLMITHKLEVMQMCDRIIVLHEGRVVEQGSYDELMAVDIHDDDDSGRGVFRKLARAGEWEG